MKKITVIITLIFLGALLTACASDKVKKGQIDAQKSVNCATAEGDIRVLKSEKAHASDQLASGISSITPAGVVMNVAGGTEGTNVSVASGDYNDMLDKKIAEIKQKCGLK